MFMELVICFKIQLKFCQPLLGRFRNPCHKLFINPTEVLFTSDFSMKRRNSHLFYNPILSQISTIFAINIFHNKLKEMKKLFKLIYNICIALYFQISSYLKLLTFILCRQFFVFNGLKVLFFSSRLLLHQNFSIATVQTFFLLLLFRC